MEYHHQQGSMDHGGEFSDYGRQQQLPPMAPRHPARPAPSVQATSGWHPGAAPGAAPSDMMGVGGPRHHMLPPNMAPMHPYSVGGGGGPTSLDQETQAQGYGEHGYHVRVPGASDGMRKPPPPHYYATSGGGVYGTRKTGGPGAMGGAVGAGPPMGMMPSYVHHQQQSQAQQPQSQAPAPAQQQAQQQQQQAAAPPSVSGVGAPRSVMSPSPAPALTHKPPKGPPAQWNKETGWAREPRRTPTLGQMAAQVQAQAQATGQAEEEEGEPMQICAAGNENTGRWTRAEHERFLNALKRYGKEWKRVAAAVRTRTVVQTRTHAQKYFQKLQKQLATGVGLAKALEMTMEDDSDADSDGDGSGGRQRGGGGGGRRKVTGGTRGGGGASGPRRMATAPSPPPAERMSDNEMGDEEEEDEDAMDDHAAESIQIMALEPQQRTISPALLSSTLRRIQPSLSIDIPEEGRGVSPLLAGGNRPQPSPAACGKRKATELEVAQALAGAAHQDMGGEDMLKNLRATDAEGEAAALRARLHNHHIHQQQQSSTTQLHIPLSSQQQPLTITNPDELEPVPGPQTVPLTPWDTEVKKLTTVYFPNNGAPEQPVGPSALEVEVLSLVRSGDLHALRKLLSRHREERLRMSGGVGKGELDLHSGDSSGQTALMVAAGLDPSVVPEKWAVELCSTLLEFASDPIITAVDNLCCTALHWAARRGNAEVVRLLVSRKASVNAQNQDGDTPLHWASRAGRTAVIKTLIEACATTHTRNRKSQSVLDVAGAGFDPDKGVLRSEEERRARDRLRDEVRRTIFELEPRLRTVIAYHPECLDHQPASRGSELESPDRVEAVMSGLQHQSDSDASPPFPPYMVEVTSGFDRATVEAVSKVHSADYVQFLDLLSREVAAKGGQPVPFKPFVPKAQLTPSQPTETTQPDTTESESSIASAPSAPSRFYFSGGSLNAARRSAGAVIYAVDQVVGARKRNAFCVVRPPGHHAGVNGMKQGSAGGGLCLFNNVAIGAFHALELCERVAIIDLDAHHGDGTEDIVRTYAESNRVFLFSIHLQQQAQAQTCSPQPTGLSASLVASGSGSEAGSAPSSSGSSCNSPLVTAGASFATQLQQNIYNVAMAPLWSKTGTSEAGGVSSSCPGGSSGGLMLQHPRGARQAPQLRGHADFRAIVTERLLPMLRSFNPNLILLSMGLNTLAKDASCCSPATGESGLDLSVGDVAWVTRKLQEVADMCCQGRIVSVLEGGYGSRTGTDSSSPLDRSVLGAAARAHVESLVNPYRREDDDDDDDDELLDARFCGPNHHPHHRGMAGGDDVATRFKAAEAHMMMLHDRSAAITTADKNKQ